MEDLTSKISELLDKAAEVARTSDSVRDRVIFASAPATIAGLTQGQTVLYLKALHDARAIRNYHAEEAEKIKANRRHSEEYRKELIEVNTSELERKLKLIENRVDSTSAKEIADLSQPLLKTVETNVPVQDVLIDVEIRRLIMEEKNQAKREAEVNRWLRDGDERAIHAILRCPKSVPIVHPNFRNDLLDRFNRQRHPENFERIEGWQKTKNLVQRLISKFVE